MSSLRNSANYSNIRRNTCFGILGAGSTSTLQQLRYLVLYLNNFGKLYNHAITPRRSVTKYQGRIVYCTTDSKLRELIYGMRAARRILSGSARLLAPAQQNRLRMLRNCRHSHELNVILYPSTDRVHAHRTTNVEIQVAALRVRNSSDAQLYGLLGPGRGYELRVGVLLRYLAMVTAIKHISLFSRMTYNYLSNTGLGHGGYLDAELSLEYLRADISLALRCDFKTQLIYGLGSILDFHNVHRSLIAGNIYNGAGSYFSLNEGVVTEDIDIDVAEQPFGIGTSMSDAVRRIELKPGLLAGLRALRHDFVSTRELKFVYQ